MLCKLYVDGKFVATRVFLIPVDVGTFLTIDERPHELLEVTSWTSHVVDRTVEIHLTATFFLPEAPGVH